MFALSKGKARKGPMGNERGKAWTGKEKLFSNL